MILTDADQLREALRIAVQERDDAREWMAGARLALVKMEAQRAELRRQLACWENASVAQLVRERDEAAAVLHKARVLLPQLKEQLSEFAYHELASLLDDPFAWERET